MGARPRKLFADIYWYDIPSSLYSLKANTFQRH